MCVTFKFSNYKLLVINMDKDINRILIELFHMYIYIHIYIYK